jgi:pyruvate dehydrogenase E1 component alpha subunit
MIAQPVVGSNGQGASGAEVTPERARALLKTMYLTRAFEEMAEDSYARGKIHGTMHLSIGQEACAAGASAGLRPDDLIMNHHRGHGHCLAKGADLNLMVAEFFGKETGYCRGRGGSMHIADVAGGNLGANGVVGGGIPLAVGVALSLKMQRSDKVVACFFGEGAANEGAFHESLNMAALWRLPVVFICENNQYAMSLPAKKGFPVADLSLRGVPFGMPSQNVDGNDVIAVAEAVGAAAGRARGGGGPSLIVCETYRWRGHSKSDQNKYRTREEIESWKKHDPIRRFRDRLIGAGALTEAQADQLEAEARAAVAAGVQFAEASPEPSPDSLEEGVYAP